MKHAAGLFCILMLSCSGNEVPSDPGEEAFARASQAYVSGDLAGAESCLLQVIRLDSLNPNAWHNLGVVLMEQGRYSEAVAALEMTILLEPGRPGARAVLCGALVGADRIEEAVAAGELAVSGDPSDATAFNNLGRAYLEAGLLQDAAWCFESAIRRAPSNPSGYFNLGCMHVMAGDPEPAIELLLETVSLSPAYPGARAQLAAAYGMLGSYAESEQQARMALAAREGDLMAMNCLAMALQGSGRESEAMEVYKAMLSMVPDPSARALIRSRMEGRGL